MQSAPVTLFPSNAAKLQPTMLNSKSIPAAFPQSQPGLYVQLPDQQQPWMQAGIMPQGHFGFAPFDATAMIAMAPPNGSVAYPMNQPLNQASYLYPTEQKPQPHHQSFAYPSMLAPPPPPPHTSYSTPGGGSNATMVAWHRAKWISSRGLCRSTRGQLHHNNPYW